MEIDHIQQKQLSDALLSAFPKRDDLEMMVFYGLGKHLTAIAKEANLEYMIFELVQWAVTNGRLEDLVRAALKYNSRNALLRSVAQELGLGGELDIMSTSPQPPKDTPPSGEFSMTLPPLPVERPKWAGGLTLVLKDDRYLLVESKEEPITKYEAKDGGSIIWQGRAMQLNKQSRPAWLKQVAKVRDVRSWQSNVQALREEATLLKRLSFIANTRRINPPQSIELYEQDDTVTLAYEYPPVKAKTLAQHYQLSDMPLDLYYIKPFLKSLLPLCYTLQELHNEKCAHRMLSPTTILVLSQRLDIAVLRDLGLAAFSVRRNEGPEGYQAPEQIDWGGRDKFQMPGPRTDIYQLAAVIYRVLTGLPVRSPENILPPSAANNHISTDLDAVLLRALAPEMDKRWPRMGDFARALNDVIKQM